MVEYDGAPLLTRLTEAFLCLPGVGPKSAQRMAFHLLQRDRKGGLQLADLLTEAMEKVGHCQSCRTFSETEYCRICQNEKRNSGVICVVESPSDVIAIEKSTGFDGRYFVLMGHLSPLDGVGPKDLGLDVLQERFAKGGIQEVILATNPTVEGSATANYISEMAKSAAIKVMKIAQGIPLGGELEYVDGGTLSQAFSGRTEL